MSVPWMDGTWLVTHHATKLGYCFPMFDDLLDFKKCLMFLDWIQRSFFLNRAMQCLNVQSLIARSSGGFE
jgi:hypothetical protein